MTTDPSAATLRPARVIGVRLVLLGLLSLILAPALALLLVRTFKFGASGPAQLGEAIQLGGASGVIAFALFFAAGSVIDDLTRGLRLEGADLAWRQGLRQRTVPLKRVRAVALASWHTPTQTSIYRAAPGTFHSAFVIADSGRPLVELNSLAFDEADIRDFCRRAGIMVRGRWDPAPRQTLRQLADSEPELGAVLRRRGQTVFLSLLGFLAAGVCLSLAIHLVARTFGGAAS